jgi:hypothetical protein
MCGCVIVWFGILWLVWCGQCSHSTAYFTSASVANRLPARSFVMWPRKWNQCSRYQACSESGLKPVVCNAVSWVSGGRQSSAFQCCRWSYLSICYCDLYRAGNGGDCVCIIVCPDCVRLNMACKFESAPSAVLCTLVSVEVGRVAQSVSRLATGWTVRGSNPGGGEIFCICPDRPWGPPSLLYSEFRVFPGGGKQPRRDADPSPL